MSEKRLPEPAQSSIDDYGVWVHNLSIRSIDLVVEDPLQQCCVKGVDVGIVTI